MLSVETRGKILVLKMSGVMKKEHLDEASELVTEKIQESELGSLLVDMRHYEGAEDLKTMWNEFKLVTANKNSVEKIAIVGNLDWQKLATLIVSPFTKATERFFEPDEIDDAINWLRD